MKKVARKKKASRTKKLLGALDVAFIIDVTGSMQAYIDEARKYVVSTMTRLAYDNDLDIKVAIVAYRDHPPQDYSFVTKTFDFDSIDNLQAVLDSLSADGGGDREEAVWDGVKALFDLSWRKNSDRIAYLIGDSPPHVPCVCETTSDRLIKLLDEWKVELNAHSIANHKDTTEAFTSVAKPTGGKITVGDRPENMTFSYSDSISSHALLVADARSFVSSASLVGTYTTANAMTTTDATSIGASLGWDKEKTDLTIKYLNKRGM